MGDYPIKVISGHAESSQLPLESLKDRQVGNGRMVELGALKQQSSSSDTNGAAERLRQEITSRNIESVKAILDQQSSLENKDAILASTYNDPQDQDVHGHRLLHWATDSLCLSTRGMGLPNLDIVRLLLDFGFHPNSRGANEDTALHCIVRVSNKETVKITKELLKRAANVNLQNVHGCTAAHEAALWRSCACLDILLAVRANLNLVNYEGLTPRDYILQIPSQGLGEDKEYQEILSKLLMPGKSLTRNARHTHRRQRSDEGDNGNDGDDEDDGGDVGGGDGSGDGCDIDEMAEDSDLAAISLIRTRPPSCDSQMDFEACTDFKGFFLPFGGLTGTKRETGEPIHINVWDMIYKDGLSVNRCTTRHRVWFHLPLNNKTWVLDLVTRLCCLEGDSMAYCNTAVAIIQASFDRSDLRSHRREHVDRYKIPGHVLQGRDGDGSEDERSPQPSKYLQYDSLSEDLSSKGHSSAHGNRTDGMVTSIVVPFIDVDFSLNLEAYEGEIHDERLAKSLEIHGRLERSNCAGQIIFPRSLDQIQYQTMAKDQVKRRNCSQVLRGYIMKKDKNYGGHRPSMKQEDDDHFDSETDDFMEYAEKFKFSDVHDQIIKVPELWMWIIGDTIVTALQEPWRDGSKTFVEDFQVDMLKSLGQSVRYNAKDNGYLFESSEESGSGIWDSISSKSSKSKKSNKSDKSTKSNKSSKSSTASSLSRSTAIEGKALHKCLAGAAIRACIKFSCHKFAILGIRVGNAGTKPAPRTGTKFHAKWNKPLAKATCHEVFSAAIAELTDEITRRYSKLRKRIGRTSRDILGAVKREMTLLEKASDVLDELNALKIVYKAQHDLDNWVHGKQCRHKPLDDVNMLIKEAVRVRRSVIELLDLRQKEANIDAAESSKLESDIVFVFTAVSVIFSPISFAVAVLALNIKGFDPPFAGALVHRTLWWSFLATLGIVILLLIFKNYLWERTEKKIPRPLKEGLKSLSKKMGGSSRRRKGEAKQKVDKQVPPPEPPGLPIPGSTPGAGALRYRYPFSSSMPSLEQDPKSHPPISPKRNPESGGDERGGRRIGEDGEGDGRNSPF